MLRQPFHHPLLLAALLTACAGGTVSAHWLGALAELGVWSQYAGGAALADESDRATGESGDGAGGMSAPGAPHAVWHARALSAESSLRGFATSPGSTGSVRTHGESPETLARRHPRLTAMRRRHCAPQRRSRRRTYPAHRPGRSGNSDDDSDNPSAAA